MSFNKSAIGRPISSSRPATSMAQHHEEEEDDDIPAQGRRKGMLPLPTIPYSLQSNSGYSTLPIKKSRGCQSAHSPKTRTSGNNMTDFSASTAMSMLHIGDGYKKVQSKEHQASSNTMKPQLTPGSSQKASICSGVQNLRTDSTESALVLFQAHRDSSVAPKTPSQIPVPSKSEAIITTPATPSRTPKSRPPKSNFLTKNSNITGYTAWDVRGRIEDMETMYEKLMAQFSGTNVERERLEEAIGIYKSRSERLSFILLTPVIFANVTAGQLPSLKPFAPNYYR